ncbi:Atrial natriuretic peptide receptor 1 [Strongyloides ratti]|uniref:Guanylate cyclase n=1 Tax=Strongyloides ratti TaxID=34506 RepID=A0A090KZ16_STRRB|nr:Atrial natriuretic peptide receptor 1 [Strongyloides ratti]CEF61122.1 Atrial natriuretic peptide receptor 1 [Strongyloides ratti]
MSILKIIFFLKFGLIFALKTIHLGFLFPLNSISLFNLTSFNLSGGVVSLALEKIKEEQLLPNYEFIFSTKFDECINSKVSAKTYELIKNGVDVIFGPSCSKASTMAYFNVKFYNKVQIGWGIQSYSNIENTKKFPNLLNINPLITSTFIALFDFLKHFKWNRLSFISASNDIGRCSNILLSFKNFIQKSNSDMYITLTYITSNPPSKKDYEYFLNSIQDKSRIVLICFDSNIWRRQFYLTIFDMKLNINEYVFINIENMYSDFNTFNFNKNGKMYKFYEDTNIPNDGRDNDAKEIAQHSFFIDLEQTVFLNYSYMKQILKKIENYPFYCKTCNVDKYNSLSIFAPSLYNAIYMWSKILNTTLTIYGDKALDDPSLYRKHCKGTYKSIFSEFSQDDNCFNNANLFITGLNNDGTTTKYFQYLFSSSNTFSKYILISDYENKMFKKWNNYIPLTVPECGLNKDKCIKSFITNNKAWFIVICIICIIIIITIIIFFFIYYFYLFQKNNKKNFDTWKLNPNNMTRIDNENFKNEILGSFHSTSISINSNSCFRGKKETNKYFYGYYDGIPIVGRKHSIKFVYEKAIKNETKECFFLEHENVNRFIGMSLEPGHIYSIWKYCNRGSLFDIIESDNSILDTFFCNNMITDLLAGLIYIHNSSIKFHGTLTSKKCMISDHWQLKISDFNTKIVRCKDKVSTLDKLWMSPEMLKSEEYIGNTEGDIYSLGIIASEIFTKKHPWDYNNRKESLEELIYLIKKGGSNSIKPDIKIADGLIFNASAISLCKECWKENPQERPVLKNIITLHKQFSASKTKNLMDHVFSNLENYAQKLKNEVDERSKEIQEEQKKSDLLLKKMLPPQIADKLKLGISVPPEDFDNVTILFSDIVKFTNLSHKCSPFQVVNILNELFSQFDNIIENLDVYKVETIGDGYLCVSGLPNRNGNNHVVEIAKLSLGFMEICENFKILHLPNEKITLRIGCNTGPCTAGVVGLSMPRYCLFGDTVNTASRMESNGKPGRIHTTESFYCLLSTFGNFIMEHRGEIIIKGKGVMNTYWLNGMTGSSIRVIKLGFLFPLHSSVLYNISGFNLSAGAIPIAIDKIKKEQILPNFNFSFNVLFDECDPIKAIGETDIFVKNNIDIVFGPTCSISATKSSLHLTFYNKPTFTWGISANSAFKDTKRLPNLITINPLISPIIIALLDILKTFNWWNIALISTTNNLGRCSNIRKGIENEIQTDTSYLSVKVSYETNIPPNENEYDVFLDDVKKNARIIIGCFDSDYWRRKFLLKMFDHQMNNSEYVLINFENRNSNFMQYNFDKSGTRRLLTYEDVNIPNDGRDEDAYKIAKYTLFIDLVTSPDLELEFLKNVLNKVEGWPFYCKTCNTSSYMFPSIFAPYLHDSIYLWAKILNKTYNIYGEKALIDGSLYRKYCKGTYHGIVGTFTYDDNCFRTAEVELTGLSGKLNITSYIKYKFSSLLNFTKENLVSDLKTTLFKTWGNEIVPNIPKCGYLNNKCFINFIENNKVLFIIICVIISIIIIILLLITIHIFLIYRKRKKNESLQWKIPFSYLEKFEKNNSLNQSMVSFQSGVTSNSSHIIFKNKIESSKYIYAFYNNQPVVGEKHTSNNVNVKEIQKELNYILAFDHKNINKYYGMCIDIGKIISIWKYSERGSLFDFLQMDSSIIDTFFCNNMLTDLLEGLNYIHNSPINYHGFLSSKKCMISNHWQLKISNFDGKIVRVNDNISSIDKLWMSPEILRSEEYIGSVEGDIYSLGIIASELFTKSQPWNYCNRKESVDEIIYLVKKGGENIFRPEIHVAEGLDIFSTALDLCRECWRENKNERPKLKNIITLHKHFSISKAKNLMDHVFFTLEDCAQKLKNEVDERSKEIQEEQKKSDLLLKKMLPPQIADKLKLGISVPPEDFDNVTILFSDIVKFTNLSHKCSPFQVVNILNELFSQFDNIIENLDVYKVETIGDGYLCVSGLPNRNGNNHVVEIAKLSLGFMEICENFKILHLPNEKITLRIGCNTGPCTAGVVGLSMPRYCLFGDTVNTASRMESNGKPGRIHTTESFYCLLSTFGNFIMEHRGEIIIKGKGVMNTYWLNGKN